MDSAVGIDDPTSIFGMDKIYSMGNRESGVDPSAIHDDFMKNYFGVSQQAEQSISKSFQEDIDKIHLYEPGNYGSYDQRSVTRTPSKNFMPPSTSGPRFSTNPTSPERPPISVTNTRPEIDRMPISVRTTETLRYGSPAKTEDERISHVLHEMYDNSIVGTPIIPLITEDDKEELLENCYLLREDLKDQKINVNNIPEPRPDMSREELEKIYRRLRIKNDRKRATSTAEEVIMLAAKGMGKIFNGKREIFGYVLDARGWDATVKGKFKRMKFDTSTWISGIMKDYTMSSGTRIAVELGPSFVLHLITNSGSDAPASKPTYNEKEWEKCIEDIDETETE